MKDDDPNYRQVPRRNSGIPEYENVKRIKWKKKKDEETCFRLHVSKKLNSFSICRVRAKSTGRQFQD